MKIVMMTGSAHLHGTTATLADRFQQGALDAGHEVYRFDAAFQDVHPCIGCDKCRRTGTCTFAADDMKLLNPHLLAADAVVFVSPIYYFTINAQLKAVIDRFYANNEVLMGGKNIFQTKGRTGEKGRPHHRHGGHGDGLGAGGQRDVPADDRLSGLGKRGRLECA